MKRKKGLDNPNTYRPKNPRRIISSILNVGIAETSRRFGVGNNTLRYTVKRYFPNTASKISSIIKKRSGKRSKNNFYFCEKYIYIIIKDRVCVTNIRFAKKVTKYSWCLTNHGYPQANIKNKRMTMHRYLYGKKDDLVIDHKNRNKLDNRIKNIRFTTQAMNVFNAVRKNKSGFRGVGWSHHCNKTNPWSAKIEFEGIIYNLGYFNTPEKAFEARVKKEVELFGSEIVL